jgi:hypothetical protein
MDELALIDDALPRAAGPDPGARAAGRQALLTEIGASGAAGRRDRTHPRLTRRRLLATAAAVAIGTAGATVAQNLRVDSGGGVLPGTPVASALELGAVAAAAAEAEPWVPPRPDQWVYTHVKQAEQADRLDGSGIWKGVDPKVTADRESWVRVDGQADSIDYVHGVWSVEEQRRVPGGREHGVWDYHTLPTDPAGLLAKLRVPYTGQPSEASDEQVFREIAYALDDPMPPKLRAAMYRLLPTLDGVVLRRNVTDQIGRPGLAFELTSNIHTYRVLVDPRSYRYLGWSITVARAFRYDNGYPETKKGTLLQSEALVESRIVDRPRQRG